MIGSTTIAGLLSLMIAGDPPSPVEAPIPKRSLLLSYKFQQGNDLKILVTESSRMLVAKGSSRQEQSNSTRTESRFEVAKTDPKGVATLRYRIDSAVMRYQFDDGPEFEFSSQSKETPEGFERIRATIGKPLLEFDISSQGIIQKVRALVRSEGKAASDYEQNPNKAVPDLFPPLPTDPVQVGSEWSLTRTVRAVVGEGLKNRLKQEVQILFTYQVAKIEGDLVTIKYHSAPVSSIDDPSIQLQVAPQEASGEIVMDASQGHIIRRTKFVDNLTIGWQGPDSSMKTVSRREEQLVSPDAAVSIRD